MSELLLVNVVHFEAAVMYASSLRVLAEEEGVVVDEFRSKVDVTESGDFCTVGSDQNATF
jgi:hypothetical protein